MEGLTPVDRSADDLEKLRILWVNEKTCPELLMHDEGLVRRLLERVQEKELEVQRLNGSENADMTLASLLWMDLNRAKFLLRAYLRTRLTKIEAHCLHVNMHTEILDRLTELEQKYAKDYAMLIDDHFREAVLNDTPAPYNSIVEQIDASAEGEEKQFDMVPAPNLDTHVFCRVVEDIGNVEIDRDTMDLQKEELLVIRYKLIRKLLQDQQIILV